MIDFPILFLISVIYKILYTTQLITFSADSAANLHFSLVAGSRRAFPMHTVLQIVLCVAFEKYFLKKS